MERTGDAVIELLVSASGASRRGRALAFLAALPPACEALLIGAGRGAVDELAHDLVARRGACVGLHRLTLTQLAALLAQPALARAGSAHATPLASLALAARSVFDAWRAGAIAHFAPVARSPGFARSAAATLAELRAAGISPADLAGRGGAESALAVLLDGYEAALASAGLADRAALFRAAAQAVADGKAPLIGRPLLLLDVPLTAPAEAAFAVALLAASPRALITAPAGDEPTLAALAPLAPRHLADEGAAMRATSLDRLRAYLFASANPPAAEPDDSVRFFSAPGEGREAVEIARAILDEAAAGTPFDDMAVLLRAPATYTPLLAAAFQRAAIPAYFAPGTTRPDPAGRALLALLGCAADGLSAKRFAEYLSFAQVPASGRARADVPWVTSDDEALSAARPPSEDESAGQAERAGAMGEEPDEASGAVAAPWRWEELLVDASVLGGAARWERRLAGLAAELAAKRAAIAEDDPASPRVAAIARDLQNLANLRAFALPIVQQLAAWPAVATWGEWLEHLAELCPRVLRRPQGVLRVLAELAPMADIGPVSVDEVRDVLTERLATLAEDPPASRYGRVFVGGLDEARGRSFAVVCVPGLAERVFPQRPREDPLLPDERRRALHGALCTQRERGARERLFLHLGVGAAGRRLYLSYPRVDVVEARPRVTSFYGLDVARAVRGGIPDVEALARDAEAAVHARLAWPAPPVPARAIDAAEHDLATLAELLGPASSARRGAARYLLELNPHLNRGLRARYARWQRGQWSHYDGLVRTTSATEPVLAAQRLSARPYSPSALEQYAICPYRFYLGAVLQLAPRQEVQPLERLDPLTRGRLFHRVQAEVSRALARAGLLPLDAERLEEADRLLTAVLDAEATRLADAVQPPIARVWDDAIAAVRTDLLAWLRQLAAPGAVWQPLYVELGFGLPVDAERDPASHAMPVRVADRALLRGAVDLVEERGGGEHLRVTDHKTGRDRTAPGMVVGGGATLQPVLYALAVEAVTGRPVDEARLFFCTARGEFRERIVRMDDRARAAAHDVLDAIDRAIARGQLPAAPRNQQVPGQRAERPACDGCDFRIVCGPYEGQRMRLKDPAFLRHLLALRAKA
ncbi:MAG: PD-(D/E)XK nuclease family protein [Candidatus Binatia bacterium]